MDTDAAKPKCAAMVSEPGQEPVALEMNVSILGKFTGYFHCVQHLGDESCTFVSFPGGQKNFRLLVGYLQGERLKINGQEGLLHMIHGAWILQSPKLFRDVTFSHFASHLSTRGAHVVARFLLSLPSNVLDQTFPDLNPAPKESSSASSFPARESSNGSDEWDSSMFELMRHRFESNMLRLRAEAIRKFTRTIRFSDGIPKDLCRGSIENSCIVLTSYRAAVENTTIGSPFEFLTNWMESQEPGPRITEVLTNLMN